MTVGKSNAREIGASDLCVMEVSNGLDRSERGRAEEDEGGDAVGEPGPEPVGDDVCPGANAVAHVEIYCTLTPAPFASAPVCSCPLPKPLHC